MKKAFNWYIEITEENYSMLLKWRKSQPNYNKSYDSCFEIGYCVTNKHYDDKSNIIACSASGIDKHLEGTYGGYVQLTTEEFKQLVLNLKDMKQTPTQTITRKQLELIYNVACSTWKTKIEKLANRDPFNNDIVLTNDEVTEMFKASNLEQTEVLKSCGLTKETDKYAKLSNGGSHTLEVFTLNGSRVAIGGNLVDMEYRGKCLVPLGTDACELTPEILRHNGSWIIVFKNK